MEVNTQFMRLENYRMETNENIVTMTGKVELVFQDNADVGGKK